LAATKAEQMAERGDFALYREFDHKIDGMEKELCDLRTKVAYIDERERRDFDDAKFLAKCDDDKIWCRMPKTERYIPDNEIVHKHRDCDCR
jgi:hypothetical protein